MTFELKPITCEIQSGPHHYILQLEDKLTVIDAPSGTGKTLLYNIIRYARVNHTKVICPLPVIAVTDNLAIQDNNVYILDEELVYERGLNTSSLSETIANANSYFIVMSREKLLAGVPFSVDNIYTLIKTHDILKLHAKYPRFYELNRTLDIKSVIIEDSTSGYEFFRQIYGDKTISSYGKSNITKLVEHQQDVLVIFDRCGFGFDITELVESIRTRSDIQLLDYESFEAFILEYLQIPVNTTFICDKEEIYTSTLTNALRKYTKSRKCPCITDCKLCSDFECRYKQVLTNARKVFSTSRYYSFVGRVK